MKINLTRDLSDLRSAAKNKVLTGAVKIISANSITDPVQLTIYADKLAQAQAYKLTGEIGEILRQEAALRLISVPELAMRVIDKAAADQQLRYQIESIRTRANIAIDQAATPAAIEQATVVDWSLHG